MLSNQLKHFLRSHIWHLLVGALLLIVPDLRLFLFFLLFQILFYVDFLRKLIRVYQAANEVRILGIMRKLKVTDDDLSVVRESLKADVGEEIWNEVEQEMRDLIKGSGPRWRL